MPQSVREDVSMEECADLLSNIPLFKHVDDTFLREVSLTTSVYLFAPGDMILYSGDMGREMYCIRKGHIEVSYIQEGGVGILRQKEVLFGEGKVLLFVRKACAKF